MGGLSDGSRKGDGSCQIEPRKLPGHHRAGHHREVGPGRASAGSIAGRAIPASVLHPACRSGPIRRPGPSAGTRAICADSWLVGDQQIVLPHGHKPAFSAEATEQLGHGDPGETTEIRQAMVGEIELSQ